MRHIYALMLSILAMLVLAVPSHAQLAGIDHLTQGDMHIVQISYQPSSGQEITPPHVFALTDDANRIVVDSAAMQGALGESPLAGQGAVLRIRHAEREGGTRLVLDLAPDASLVKTSHSDGLTQITIKAAKETSVQNAALSTNAAPRRAVQKSPLGVPFPRVKPLSTSSGPSEEPARRPVIIIDPGHGGYDPGAIGAGGTQEKTITLAAAKELERQLLSSGKYDVVLTRNKDVYVVHDERVKVARLKDADLFISIHADSLERRSTRGASVYTLADYARKRSTKLVDSQNWIMDVDLSQENERVGDILVDLAQRKTFSNSDRFAEMLVPELTKVTQVLGNAHRRAGLAVLLAPDVPAVLVEMGFISNAQDEAALNSTAHRKKLMGALIVTIDDYFKG